MKWLQWTIIIVISTCGKQINAATDIVRFVDATSLKQNPNNQYFIAALDLALQKSQQEFGDYILQPIDIPILQSRHFVELSLGRIDVFWTMASAVRDSFARPIKVPLAFGSYGIRILAINKTVESKMAAISDVVALNNYTALSGSDWPDTSILKHNGVAVDEGHSEVDFYKLVNQFPAFYYPRAVTEILNESARLAEPNVTVEKTLTLMYPAVMYFYVANDNLELAKRLEKGLLKAIDDGSLEQLFFNFEHHKMAFQEAKVHQRRFIYLDNPILPKGVDVKLVRQLQEQIIDASRR